MAKSRKKQLRILQVIVIKLLKNVFLYQEKFLQKARLRGEKGTKEGLNNYGEALGSSWVPNSMKHWPSSEAMLPSDIWQIKDFNLCFIIWSFGIGTFEGSYYNQKSLTSVVEELIRDYGDVASTYLQEMVLE